MKIEWDGDFIPDDQFWQEVLDTLSTDHYKLGQLREIVSKCSRALFMPTFSSWRYENVRVRSKEIVWELRKRTENGELEYLKKCLLYFIVEDAFTYNDLNILLERTSLRCIIKEKESMFKQPGTEYSKFGEDTALAIVESLLENFDKFETALIREKVHKSAGVCQSAWASVSIKNEYDVQRMLYAWLRPVFPTVRTEVYSDSGYVGMRADLYIGDYDLIIETKCTRKTMTEKSLNEEISSDGWNYEAANVYLLVYDKDNIIKNKDAFEVSFMKHSTRQRRYRAFVTNPLSSVYVVSS